MFRFTFIDFKKIDLFGNAIIFVLYIFFHFLTKQSRELENRFDDFKSFLFASYVIFHVLFQFLYFIFFRNQGYKPFRLFYFWSGFIFFICVSVTSNFFDLYNGSLIQRYEEYLWLIFFYSFWYMLLLPIIPMLYIGMSVLEFSLFKNKTAKDRDLD